MADFSLGSAGTGRLEVTQNWNTSTQVSYRVKLTAITGGGWYDYGPGPSWNWNAGGNVASGGWSYGGNGTYVLADASYTFNKNANGTGTWNFYGYINGNNSPGIGAGSTNFNMSPARIGVAPTIVSASATNVSVVTATINMNTSDFGLGTSVTQRMFYKKTTDGSWTQVSDQSGTGAKSWNLTGLIPATSYHFLARAINNNGDTRNLPTTYPSESYKFTTLPAPAVNSAMLGIIGVM